MPPGKEKFVSIADLGGWGYTNSDIRGYLAALSILQVHSFNEKSSSAHTSLKQSTMSIAAELIISLSFADGRTAIPSV